MESKFLELPPEIRGVIYDAFDDSKALRNVAQSCKQVNEEINPPVDKTGLKKYSPWKTLRERHYPKFDVPTGEKSRSERWLYRASKATFFLRSEAEQHRSAAGMYRSFLPNLKDDFQSQYSDLLAKDADKEAERLLKELDDVE